jgi:AP-3 complex subunit delta
VHYDYDTKSSIVSILDIKAIHVVNTVIEMPEGAIMSDSEDKNFDNDPNDPHRALDIDLDV